MDLNTLSLFVAVADAAGVSAAAEQLGLPKSSVSRGLSRLEAELGVTLVHRTTRRVSLSTAGQALYERIKPLVLELEDSLTALPERKEAPSGKLRVTMPLDFAVGVLADIVARFSEQYPTVELDLEFSSRFVDIVADGFDIALRISPRKLQDSSLIARPLISLATKLYAAPAYLKKHPPLRTPNDLLGHRFVGQSWRRKLELVSSNSKVSVPLRASLRSNDLFFTRSLLKAQAGVGLLPAFLGEEDVRQGQLRSVLPNWTMPSGRVWLVRPNAAQVPAKVRAFERFVVNALKALTVT